MTANPQAEQEAQRYREFKRQKWNMKHGLDKDGHPLAHGSTGQDYEGYMDYKRQKWEKKHTMKASPIADKDY